MNVVETPIPGVLIIEPKTFGDSRGFFLETFNADRYRAAGIKQSFVQDNWSRSNKNTLRGLHFQEPNPQGKLVMVMRGTVWDVAVDIRKGSPTFGRWHGVELSESNKLQYWVPPGFAHGFCVLSDEADFVYKCTALYDPKADQSIAWDDPAIGIQWPISSPLLSNKDRSAPQLRDAPIQPSYSTETP